MSACDLLLIGLPLLAGGTLVARSMITVLDARRLRRVPEA